MTCFRTDATLVSNTAEEAGLGVIAVFAETMTSNWLGTFTDAAGLPSTTAWHTAPRYTGSNKRVQFAEGMPSLLSSQLIDEEFEKEKVRLKTKSYKAKPAAKARAKELRDGWSEEAKEQARKQARERRSNAAPLDPELQALLNERGTARRRVAKALFNKPWAQLTQAQKDQHDPCESVEDYKRKVERIKAARAATDAAAPTLPSSPTSPAHKRSTGRATVSSGSGTR